jgi:hypothetical protein
MVNGWEEVVDGDDVVRGLSSRGERRQTKIPFGNDNQKAKALVGGPVKSESGLASLDNPSFVMRLQRMATQTNVRRWLTLAYGS